jgi:hypothetical protein
MARLRLGAAVRDLVVTSSSTRFRAATKRRQGVRGPRSRRSGGSQTTALLVRAKRWIASRSSPRRSSSRAEDRPEDHLERDRLHAGVEGERPPARPALEVALGNFGHERRVAAP